MTLDRWLKEQGKSQSDVARALGTTRQTVQYWCAGTSRPSLYFALSLAALTGGRVSAESWLTQQEWLAVQGLKSQGGQT
jgi:transcriptional regulator with XRE-family HTH domain